MEQPLVIVLPMHNQQRYVASTVHEVLELAHTSQGRIEVVVVDDGSTDDTFETACELARAYPQLTVLRQRVRQGLRAALELVRNRTDAEMVLMHDGVSAFNQVELKHLITAKAATVESTDSQWCKSSEQMDNSGSRRFASISALHDDLEQAHRSISGFCWLRLDKPLIPRRRSTGGDKSLRNRSDANRAAERSPIAPLLANLPAETNPVSLV